MEDKRLLKYVWIFVLLFLLYKTLILLGDFMLSIQGAFIFSVIFYPLYLKLLKKIKKKSLAAFSVLLIVLFGVLVPLVLVSFTLVNQASGLAEINSERIQAVENFLASINIDINIDEEGVQLVQNIKSLIFSNIINLLQRATDFLINFFIFFFLLYYLLIQGPSVKRFVKRYMPFSENRNDEFLKQSSKIVRAIAYGSIVTALIQGFLGGIGFLIFGVDKALFWGFIMAILSILPIIGSWLIWGPASLFLISEGSIISGVGLFIWGVIVVSQSDNIIKPFVTSKLGNIHPIVILLGVFAGLALFGVVGILSGPIILGIIVLLVQFFHDEKNIVITNNKKG